MTAIVIVLAYLLGSIPSGIWIGKYFYQTDIRKYGSGNSGTTNTFRVLGKKAGSIVLIMDMLKGSAATLLPIWLGVEIHPLLAGVVAALGHTYPLFAGFKGGKAVATSAGIMLAYNPLFFWGSNHRFRHLPLLLQNGQPIQHPGQFYSGRSFLLL